MPTTPFRIRILVVDDEPIILETMSAILESRGYAVRTAHDGFAGLATLRETLPDMIISDLRMPNMSGFEFLSIVRRRFPHIPIIVISGEFVLKGTPATRMMDLFLQKGGYTHDELFGHIERLIKESPIRPHLAKIERCPLWIPRREIGYVVVTCMECLRSFPATDISEGDEVRTTDCPACSAEVKYLVDSATLDAMEKRRQMSA